MHRLPLGLAALLLLAGCGDARPALPEPSTIPTSYRFDLSAFCGERSFRGDYRVTVRDGEVVALLTPGSVVGEISFLLKRHRTADVYASSDGTEFLSLRGRNLTALIEGESRAAARLLYNLSRIMAQRLAGS